MQPSAKSGQHGSILVYLALCLVVFGVLVMAGLVAFSSSVRSILSPDCATSSRYMAESGIRYALARLRACTDETCVTSAVSAMNGHSYTVASGSGLGFTLGVTYDSTAKTASVTSTGTSCNAGSTSQAQSGTVNLPNIPVIDPSTVGISNFNDFTVLASKSGSLTLNAAKDTASMGNQVQGFSASLIYTGSNALCTSGNCTLGNGLCTTFRYQFNPNAISTSNHGDGFTWTIMNANTNTYQSQGGGGENMGYSGVNDSGSSILPPKFGLEFDVTYNYKNCGKPCPASIDNFACDITSDDHVAFLFWGLLTLSCGNTRDDHVHGAGAGTDAEPYNSDSADNSMDGLSGYYVRGGSGAGYWMWNSSPQYYVRYEIDRPTTANAQGDYVYRERAWVVKSTDSYASTLTNCTQTHSAYPTLSRTYALTPSDHAKMAQAIFGFTTGAGSYTETIKVDRFSLYFKGTPATPTTPTVPTSGLVAAYTFSEAANATAYDSSGYANTGAISGVSGGQAVWGLDVRATNSASLLLMPYSTSLGMVTVPHSASLALTSTGSVSCWIWIRQAVTNAGIVHKGTATGSNEAFSLQLTSSGKIAFSISNTVSGANTILSAESGVGVVSTTGKWYHVAATWDATSVKLYINGALNASTANTSGMAARNVSTALLIGSLQSASGYGFNGMIDDVYLYSRALSAAEVANLALGHP